MKKTLKLVALSALAVTAMAGCTGDSVQPTAAGSAYNDEDVVKQPTGYVMHRALGEYLASQGSYCMDDGTGECALYAKPVMNHIAFYDQAKNKTIMVDYAGTTNQHMIQNSGRDFGTILSGEILEEPMSDGRSKVTVTYSGTEAMVYMVNGIDVMAAPIFMGVRPIDLMAQPEAKPTTGRFEMTVSYINQAPGLPIPDLIQLARFPQPGQQLLETQFTFKGSGINAYGKPMDFVIEQQGPVMPALPGADFRISPPAAHATMTVF